MSRGGGESGACLCLCVMHISTYVHVICTYLFMRLMSHLSCPLVPSIFPCQTLIPPYEHSFPHVNKMSVEVFLQYILTASAKDAVRGDFTSTDSKRNYLTISHWDEAVL